MRVALGRPAALMAKQLLDIAEVGSILKQMGGERVAKGMHADRLANARTAPYLLEQLLHAALREMPTPVLSRKQPISGLPAADITLDRSPSDVRKQRDAVLAPLP